MSVDGIEAACDAIIAKLRTELPAAIDTYNAEVTDGHALEVLEDVDEQIKLGSRADMPLPFIAVMPADDEVTTDSGARVHFNDRIEVVTWCANYDQEALVRQNIRFARTARRVVLRGRIPGAGDNDYGYGLQLRGGEYGDAFRAEEIPEGQFVIFASSVFAVQAFEDIP